MEQGESVDWVEALTHLRTAEEIYASIGTAGMLSLVRVIAPLRDRYNAGERSKELYAEIMQIEL